MAYTPIRKGKSPAVCFAKTSTLYESTPKQSSALHTSRKRKFASFEADSTPSSTYATDVYPFTPPASSTLNESLIDHLAHFNIEGEHDHIVNERPVKYVKNDENASVHSAPTTPQKQVFGYDERRSSSASYGGCKALPHILESPLSEKHDILYPSLKPVGGRTILTPKKFTDLTRKCRSPPKKSLFAARENNRALQLLQKVTSIDGVMGIIFKYLSNGDLYRVSRVSMAFERSVLNNKDAQRRLCTFTEHHKLNKENYHITPPSSPEKDDTPPRSPDSRHFYEFTKVGKDLEPDQYLMKCLQCSQPAVVTDNIAQCAASKCGYIYCKQCGSQSTTGPEDFHDKCGRAVLQYSVKRELSDLSNLCEGSISIFTSPITSSRSVSMVNASSGYYSCSESEHTRSISVKRNLSSSFNSSDRILCTLNRMSPKRNKTKRRSALTPVCKVKSIGDVSERDPSVWEPPSPPKVQDYSICSRRSKRNLKRLTR